MRGSPKNRTAENKLLWTTEVSNDVDITTPTEAGDTKRRRRRLPAAATRASKRQRTGAGLAALKEQHDSTAVGLCAIDAAAKPAHAVQTRVDAAARPAPHAIAAAGECVCVPGGGHGCRADACRPYRAGDVAIIQERYNRVFQIELEESGKLDTRYGRYHHDELLGRAPGVRWAAAKHQVSGSATCAGFMHALRLGPVCWGTSVSHRTQIVHAHDAALIVLRLGLAPGAHVVEAGVGSAALSAQIGWAVAPNGRVSAFEFHAERAAAARSALAVAKVPVTVRECDVLESGFVGVGDGQVDAVFLDLPRPEDVVDEAERVLVDGGRVCCFSPCVEQVQRTCANLRAGKWHSIVSITAPVRTYETKLALADGKTEGDASHYGKVKRAGGRLYTRAFSEMKGHTSYLTFATKMNSNAMVDAPLKKTKLKQENGCVLT